MGTACILCSENCGLLVDTADGHITAIRGDKAHPHSRGLSVPAARLDPPEINLGGAAHPQCSSAGQLGNVTSV